MADTVRYGIVGLGRMGRRHAENLAWRVPGARIVAACSTVPDELAYARDTPSARPAQSSSSTTGLHAATSSAPGT